MNLPINGRRKTPKALENAWQRLYDCVYQPASFVMTDARTSTTLQDQTSATSPVSAHTLSSEAVLDALKMILLDAPLNNVLTSIALLIEAHTPGALCSVFLLDEDGVHLRYAAAPTLSDDYRIATEDRKSTRLNSSHSQ